jgi:signal peptidase II
LKRIAKLLFLPIIALLVALDQWTKYWAINSLQSVPFKTVIPGILDFRYVENRGAAFGILENHQWVFMLFTTIVVVTCFVLLFIKNKPSKLLNTVFILIISGGIGNMIDRVFRNYVVDFINITFVDFYVFNIADCLIVSGASLLCLYLVIDIFKEKKRS